MVSIPQFHSLPEREAGRIMQDESLRFPLPLDQSLEAILEGRREAIGICLLRLQLRLGEVCDADFGPGMEKLTIEEIFRQISSTQIPVTEDLRYNDE